jgi:hypothetical protein
MLRLLRFLWTGEWHLHKWRILKEVDCISTSEDKAEWTRYYLQCEHCGEIKSYDHN